MVGIIKLRSILLLMRRKAVCNEVIDIYMYMLQNVHFNTNCY